MSLLIHWFPGHMTKALREMEAVLPLVDIVFLVLDSRAVKSCANPEFERLMVNKRVVYILNKADLVEPSALKKWENVLKANGKEVVSINSQVSGSAKSIFPLVLKLVQGKIDKYKEKGIKISLRAMVIGVPNSGKSTLINNLCSKAKAKTGNKPGITRGQQWLRATEWLELLDTPGTLYPKLEDQTAAKRLAFIGSIKDEIVDKQELAFAFLDELLVLDKDIISSKYNIDFSEFENDKCESVLEHKTIEEQILERIAQNRGFYLKGGILDIERAANSLLDDFRKGRLGKIMLDKI